jgi:hypothetical protein
MNHGTGLWTKQTNPEKKWSGRLMGFRGRALPDALKAI